MCKESPFEMAQIIQAMQADIAERQQERIVNKFLVFFHDAKKVLKPWDDSFLDNPFLRNIWYNDISGNISQLSNLRHGTSHFIDTTKNGMPLQECDMRMKFILEKLTDANIMTPKVRNELKTLGGSGNDPVESMIQMLDNKYKNVEITPEYRIQLECQWKYL